MSAKGKRLGLIPIARAIYYRLFRLRLRVRIWCADRVGIPPSEVPVPPALLRFRVSESLSVREFLRVGAGCANLVRQHVGDMGTDIANTGRVLDFGCGCGRTIGWFLRDGGTAEFHGVDTDADAVDWCGGHLRRGHFVAIAPVPPLPYSADYFDVAYCFSVFTHLDESMQDLWLPELNRILKPGGVLLITVYGDAAIGTLDGEGQDTLRTRGFVHRRSQKLRGLLPDWYHTTWHSREYIVERLRKWFGDVRYEVVPGGMQNVVVAKKSNIPFSTV